MTGSQPGSLGAQPGAFEPGASGSAMALPTALIGTAVYLYVPQHGIAVHTPELAPVGTGAVAALIGFGIVGVDVVGAPLPTSGAAVRS